MARRTGRPTIIAAEGAFHGRTMGALALTGQPSKRTPFEPLTPGVSHVPYGDVAALARRRRLRHRRGLPRTDHGGGGRRHPARRATSRRPGRSPPSAARCSCSTRCRPASGAPAPGSPTSRRRRAGRHHAGQGPRRRPADRGVHRPRRARPTLFEPGQHGTTFGGNPVCAAAALAVLDTIAADGLLEHTALARQAHRHRRRGAGPPAGPRRRRCRAADRHRADPAGVGRRRRAGPRGRVPRQQRRAGPRAAGPAAGAHRGAGGGVPRRAARDPRRRLATERSDGTSCATTTSPRPSRPRCWSSPPR